MRACALAVSIAALALAAPGAASWSILSAGSAAGKAGVLVGNKPTATKSGVLTLSVLLTWAPTPGASGYVVTRTGGLGGAGGTCSGTVTTTTCSDTPVLALQVYTYTITPVRATWTGTPSEPTTIRT